MNDRPNRQTGVSVTMWRLRPLIRFAFILLASGIIPGHRVLTLIITTQWKHNWLISLKLVLSWPLSKRAVEDQRLTKPLKEAWNESGKVYG